MRRHNDWIPAASGHGWGQRTSTSGIHSPSCEGWGAYKVAHHFWWTDHFSEEEGTTQAQSLSCLCSNLTDLCIELYPKIPCCFDPLYWLSENLDCSGSSNASRSLCSLSVFFETFIAIRQSHRMCSICRNESQDKCWEAIVGGMWLREPCGLHRVLARRGLRV
jgi:hypothetical protein